jgi:hypothetical protein
MGFRSTMVSEHLGHIRLPTWFCKKWAEYLHLREWDKEFCFPISSRVEYKTYGIYVDMELDLQKVLIEHVNSTDYPVESLELVYFHECGGITKVIITETNIKYMEPAGWVMTNDVTHYYCYGCSDAR